MASGLAFLSGILSLSPAASRIEAGETRPAARLHRLVLGFTFAFVLLALAASSSFVVYTGWTHDLKNGTFALAFAVMSAHAAMNWFAWKDEAE